MITKPNQRTQGGEITTGLINCCGKRNGQDCTGSHCPEDSNQDRKSQRRSDQPSPISCSDLNPLTSFKSLEPQDIATIRELAECVPALRRYLGHRLKNDANMLVYAIEFNKPELVGEYIARLKTLLDEVGL